MTVRSIVAVASGGEDDAQVFALAARLAARSNGHVRVVPAFPDPAADFVSYGAALKRGAKGPAAERVAASERETQEGIEAQAEEVAAREGLAREALAVDKRDLQPALALAPAAMLADLVLFGGAAARGALAGLFAETLIYTRAPCLLVKGTAYAFGPAAVAWDGSAQAARAVKAALPLLQMASGVFVLQNIEDAPKDADAANPDRLTSYLDQHDVANVATRPARGERVAPSLLAAARADQCELLVAGAYGRPRLYELVLGGTTRALTDAVEPPHVLLAH
jgi:nucleotide-binding universal stress UspA family protein